MEDFIFYEGDPRETKALEFEPSYFHTPDFIFLKASSGWKWYYAVRSRTNNAAISLYIHTQDEVARTSVQSPYGTIECADDVLPEIIFQFLQFVEKKLLEAGVQRIIIRNPPFHYNEKKNSLLTTFLLNLGYTVVDAEVGAIRIVTASFEDKLNRLEIRKLKKCLENGLTIHSHPLKDLENIYSFINHCRQLKGYTLSMTLAQLERDAERFPKNYVLMSVQKDKRIVGASIAVQVSRDILYNFYADHDSAFDAISPVVLVVKSLYEYCQEQKLKMLDMGTSAIDGKPNFGLLNLKIRLGGTPTPKLTFEKIMRV